MSWRPKAPVIPEVYEFVKKAKGGAKIPMNPAKYNRQLSYSWRKKILQKYEAHADECFELVQLIEWLYQVKKV